MSDIFETHLKALEDISVPRKQAVIREAECIGCTKCISACPVDSILGANKQIHTVLAMECTGCELCVAPCPVDCIDIISIPEKDTIVTRQKKLTQFKNRYETRQKRLAENNTEKTPTRKTASTALTLEEKKSYIQAALLRVKKKTL